MQSPQDSSIGGLFWNYKEASMAAMEPTGGVLGNEVRGRGAKGECLGDEVRDLIGDCRGLGFTLK